VRSSYQSPPPPYLRRAIPKRRSPGGAVSAGAGRGQAAASARTVATISRGFRLMLLLDAAPAKPGRPPCSAGRGPEATSRRKGSLEESEGRQVRKRKSRRQRRNGLPRRGAAVTIMSAPGAQRPRNLGRYSNW